MLVERPLRLDASCGHAVEDALRAALPHERPHEVNVVVEPVLVVERHAVRVYALHRLNTLEVRYERRARRRPVLMLAVHARYGWSAWMM